MVHRVDVSYVYPLVPLTERVIMSEGSVYNCKNHPNLRWFDTKPNGRLVFSGEITEEGNLKESYPIDPGNPMNKLRHYMNGKNPYDPSLDLDTPFTWVRLKDFMAGIAKVEEKGWVFECECPSSDLVRLPDETYETVYNRPHLPKLD